MAKKVTTEDFIERARRIHADKYVYSKSVYVKNSLNVIVECPKHGDFYITPANHYNGSGCKQCHFDGRRGTINEFIEDAKKIHGGVYDYSMVEYVNSHTKVTIICSEHGEFFQTPSNHIFHKQKCPSCTGNKKITLSEFIKKSHNLHGDRYDYSYVKFKDMFTEVCIKCPIHGETFQQPRNHLRSTGCVNCSYEEFLSSQVKEIRNLLKCSNIKFEMEYTFNDCRNKKLLPYDFFVEQFNLCIEYDGRHHYEPIKHWGGDSGFKSTQKNDFIKTNYCKDKNINLLRIKYDEDHIETLKQYFKESFGIDLKD